MPGAPDRSEGGNTPVVTGNVVIGAATPPLNGAGVHVRLEDVSYADRPSELVEKTVVADVHHPPPGLGGDRHTIVPFTIRPVGIDARKDYAVRVWVDADGDGRVGPGDLYSDQSHRVLTHGHSNIVTIKLGVHVEP